MSSFHRMNNASIQLVLALTRRSFALCTIAMIATLLFSLGGCASRDPGVEVDVRPEFLLHDRVALWPVPMPRPTEDFFIPLYMAAFPNQVVVERRDVAAVIGEQDVLPERLNETTRAKLRKILGVKAILYSSITDDGFAIKVIDTDTGAITASVFVYADDPKGSPIPMQDLVRHAIGAMQTSAGHLKPPAEATAQNIEPATGGGGASTAPAAVDPAASAAPEAAPAIPVSPPPHD